MPASCIPTSEYTQLRTVLYGADNYATASGDSAMSDPLLHEINDGIALITLNRPDKLNALNFALIDRLMAALDAIETDDSVRAVILTGGGERAFSAGADIHEFSGSVRRGRAMAVRDFVRRGQAMTARLEGVQETRHRRGQRAGVRRRMRITEAVHLAIASERARFAKPEINLGMPPTFGGTQRLPRLVRRKRALELLLTGRPRSRRCGRWRSASSIWWCRMRCCCRPRANWRRASSASPLRSAAFITAVTRGLNMGIAEGLQVESEQFAVLVPISDLGEGINAWIERRQPPMAVADAGHERRLQVFATDRRRLWSHSSSGCRSPVRGNEAARRRCSCRASPHPSSTYQSNRIRRRGFQIAPVWLQESVTTRLP